MIYQPCVWMVCVLSVYIFRIGNWHTLHKFTTNKWLIILEKNRCLGGRFDWRDLTGERSRPSPKEKGILTTNHDDAVRLGFHGHCEMRLGRSEQNVAFFATTAPICDGGFRREHQSRVAPNQLILYRFKNVHSDDRNWCDKVAIGICQHAKYSGG